MSNSSANIEPGDEAEVEGHGFVSQPASTVSSANDEPGDEVEGHILSS